MNRTLIHPRNRILPTVGYSPPAQPGFGLLGAKDVPIPQAILAHYPLPPTAQQYDSCGGDGTANALEVDIRRVFGRRAFSDGQQLDNLALWRKARQIDFPDEPVEGGGLWVDSAIKAAIALGFVPPDTEVISTDLDLSELCVVLGEPRPVLQGLAIGSSWESPSKINGMIQDWKPDQSMGHLTPILGMLEQGGEFFRLFLQSWGYDYGYHGLALVREPMARSAQIAPLTYWRYHTPLSEWTGWKDFIITPGPKN